MTNDADPATKRRYRRKTRVVCRELRERWTGDPHSLEERLWKAQLRFDADLRALGMEGTGLRVVWFVEREAFDALAAKAVLSKEFPDGRPAHGRSPIGPLDVLLIRGRDPEVLVSTVDLLALSV